MLKKAKLIEPKNHNNHHVLSRKKQFFKSQKKIQGIMSTQENATDVNFYFASLLAARLIGCVSKSVLLIPKKYKKFNQKDLFMSSLEYL